MLTAAQVSVVAWRTEDGETLCTDCVEDGEMRRMRSVTQYEMDEEQAALHDGPDWKGCDPICCDKCGREIVEGTPDELPRDLVAWRMDDDSIACTACADEEPWRREEPIDEDGAQEWACTDGPMTCDTCGGLIWPLEPDTIVAHAEASTPANTPALAALTAILL